MNIIKSIEQTIVTLDNTEDVSNAVKKEIFELLSLQLDKLREEVVKESKQYLGIPSFKYKSPEKGMTPDGFDCSGFVTFILSKYGLSKKGIRHSNEYFDNYGVFVHTPIAGDLIFFSDNGGYTISYMNLYWRWKIYS